MNLADVGDNRINQSDVRNLLRRGTSDGYAEVDFLGVDGHRYRSCWSVRRTRNKVSGSLQPQMMEVKELDTGKEFQGTKKELLAQLVELIGLTYEQFTRTVLLAQNDFATFLKSKGAAKAELLEKLTGTGVYSFISQEVFARNKAAQEEVALIHNKMSVIELIPEEDSLPCRKKKSCWLKSSSEGIKLLAEQNAQLNVVRSLKTQEELRTKKQKEEQGETGQTKDRFGHIGLAGGRFGSFQSPMGSYTARLEASPSTGCADTVPTRGLYTVSTTIAGSPQAGAGAGQEKTDG